MNIRTALLQASRRLEAAGIPAPRLTAEVLLAHVAGRERAWFYSHPEQEIDSAMERRWQDLLRRRIAGVPTQYLTGTQEFYGRGFRVTPDVFIPRPETEHVVAAALEIAPPDGRYLDVGAGSGAVAVTLALERPLARVAAAELSAAALCVARDNARRLGARVDFFLGDLTSAVAPASLDLLVSNPPYIPEEEELGLQREVRDHEPRLALFAGPQGLDAYKRLATDAARIVRPGGAIVFELGYRQVEPVRAMLDARWGAVRVISDLAGLPRVLVARLAETP